jgi:ABC-type Co2+ transport system permease subunit
MIFFHRFLIATAILFSIGFAVWSFAQFQGGGGTTQLVLAVVFAVIAVGLIVYLKNLKRFLHR